MPRHGRAIAHHSQHGLSLPFLKPSLFSFFFNQRCYSFLYYFKYNFLQLVRLGSMSFHVFGDFRGWNKHSPLIRSWGRSWLYGFCWGVQLKLLFPFLPDFVRIQRIFNPVQPSFFWKLQIQNPKKVTEFFREKCCAYVKFPFPLKKTFFIVLLRLMYRRRPI